MINDVSMTTPAGLDAELPLHRGHLFAVCYRMTGSSADAEDLVQETFLRVLDRPPRDASLPLRPWLVKVAMNLARDLLRARRRRGYVGPWLPGPAGDDAEEAIPEPRSDAADGPLPRYEMKESVTMAFLLALEALTPNQRAVLVLRDVLDYRVAETGRALGLSEANVKQLHHRARGVMARYEGDRCVPTPSLEERTRDALVRFLTALSTGDAAAVEELLAEDAVALSDGGGEYRAATRVVSGRERVARLYLGLASKNGVASGFDMRTVAGLPAVVLSFDGVRAGNAPRVLFQCRLDASGRIGTVYTLLASRKLAGLS